MMPAALLILAALCNFAPELIAGLSGTPVQFRWMKPGPDGKLIPKD